MRRRSFLASLTVGAAAGPAWLRRAFADVCVTSPDGRMQPQRDGTDDVALVREALARAKRRSRPLLAIVVPASQPARSHREATVTEWLLDQGDEAIVRLGGAELIAATIAQLRAAGLGVPGGDFVPSRDDVILVRVAPDGELAVHAALEKSAAAFNDGVAALLPAPRGPTQRTDWLAQARRLRRGPMPGANWSYYVGCSHHMPHDASPTDERHSIGCGMGSMGSEARRFLRFFVAAR